MQFFSPDWEPNSQPSNYHFATNLRQFDNISSPQKERIGNVLSYAFPCAWPLKRLSSYLVWVGVKFSNAKEEELLINDASQIGSKKFDFSIE